MRKALLVAFCVAVLCSLFLTGIVSGAKAGYGFSMFNGADLAAWDGKVSPANEWDDSFKDWLYDGWTKTTSFFRCKWGMTPAVCENWLMEFIGDTTNDAGDWWEIDVDANANGGTAPQADDFKLNWTAADGVKIWRGTGTGWTTLTGAVAGTAGDYFGITTISESPASATPHRIVEIYLNKGVSAANPLAMGLNVNERLAIFNAATGQTVMWPPYSSADNPDTYGAGTTDISGGTIPEGLTIGVMLTVSSAAVIVGSRYFRKRPRIESCGSGKP